MNKNRTAECRCRRSQNRSILSNDMTNFLMEDDSQLRLWAYDPDSFKSVGQDFELTVASLDRANIILECASDNECPMQHFFVNCAYIIVGDIVGRSDRSNDLERDLIAFVRRAEKTGNEHLLEFVWRARSLIDNPSEFDSNQWRGGCIRLLPRNSIEWDRT